ncbi:MAG: hypothetical protein Q7J73_07215 [Dehalococcoidales bacterium]|nr:hypothetical protein [Dehalococcoidales bacterium]
MSNPTENETGEQSIVELKTLLETERRARTAAEAEVAKREAVITEINAAAGAAKQSLTAALAAYKALVVRSNPVVFAELISGDSFEAINNSLESAKALISKVRQSVEAEIAAGKVPAGAPARTLPDLENLSSREKIQYAISKGGKI